MKVLVTGATGFVGRELLRQLHAAGYPLRLLVRNPASPTARRVADEFHADLRQGDVIEGGSLAAAARGMDAVVHLVGIIGEIGRNTFENAHVRATGNMLQAARDAGVRRFIQMSALGTRPDAVARYHRTKWAAEELVRGSGLDWTIFRPSLIYGAGDRFVNLFAGMSRWSPLLPVMGSGQGRLQPVAVEAVATAFAAALAEPRAIGRTLDLCGPEALSLVALLDTILSVLGRRRVKLHIPLPLARALAAILELVWPRLLGCAAPLNRDQLLMLQEDNVGDPGPAAKLFDLKLAPFREGIGAWLGR